MVSSYVKDWCGVLGACFCAFLMGFSLFAGILFGIYYPILYEKVWETGDCKITGY
jgi:hypothetical protein